MQKTCCETFSISNPCAQRINVDCFAVFASVPEWFAKSGKSNAIESKPRVVIYVCRAINQCVRSCITRTALSALFVRDARRGPQSRVFPFSAPTTAAEPRAAISQPTCSARPHVPGPKWRTEAAACLAIIVRRYTHPSPPSTIAAASAVVACLLAHLPPRTTPRSAPNSAEKGLSQVMDPARVRSATPDGSCYNILFAPHFTHSCTNASLFSAPCVHLPT